MPEPPTRPVTIISHWAGLALLGWSAIATLLSLFYFGNSAPAYGFAGMTLVGVIVVPLLGLIDVVHPKPFVAPLPRTPPPAGLVVAMQAEPIRRPAEPVPPLVMHRWAKEATFVTWGALFTWLACSFASPRPPAVQTLSLLALHGAILSPFLLWFREAVRR